MEDILTTQERAVVFLDLDGTLLHHPGEVSPLVLEGIRQLREKGHLALACTGRATHLVPPELWQVGLDGIITLSGCYAQVEDTPLYEIYYPQPLVRRLLGRMQQLGISGMLEGSRESIIFSPIGLEEYAKLGGRTVTSLEQLEAEHPDYHFSKTLLWGGDLPLLGEDRAALEKELVFVDTNTGYYELALRGVSKDSGIRAVLEHLGRDVRGSYGIGDSDNDLGMLDYVETAIAMGSAQDHVKARADYVTGTLEEDGVYWALKHFGLI